MKQIVLSILIAILYVACAFGEEPVTSPDLTQIRIKENPGETLEYVGKIGNDYDSALDSLRKLKAISSEIIKEPLEVVFDYDDRFFFGIIYDDCGMYSDVLDTEGNYYLRSWYSSEDNTNGIIVSTNPMESLYGEWRLVGWDDKGSWFEVDSSYVSHQHLTIDFKENGYVMAYSMANEICVGRLTLNGNEMIFGGEMRGWSTEVYVDMMENEFFEDHICDIKSYQLEGYQLRLYYTDDDYFVFSNEYLKPIIPKENDIANYRPFIEDGKVWKVGELDQYGTFLPRLSYYYFDGDTIVGGKACKRMMCRHEANKGFEFEDGSLSYTNYAGAFYEENKQVYFALPTNDWFDRLYDFGAEIGETIDIYDWAKILGPHTSPFTITQKEEENSEFFKGICIEVNGKEELSHIKAVWREGIGGKEGPINNLSDRDALMSCTVGDEVLYKNPYFEDLYPDIESGETTPTPTAKRRVDFTHVVKKKPKAPQRRVQESEDVAVSGEYTQTALTIDLGTLQDTYVVTITDPSGQSVYAKDVKTNRVLALDIDISAYTEDAYTITLENEDEIFEGNFRLSDLTNDLKYIELTKEERELVKNNNEFAFRLFDKARDDESCIMSPLSITYALGMLNNGADGQTREEINQVLGNVDNAASPELINQFCQKLLTEAPQLDKETTAEIANTIYVNRGTGYELQQGFVDKVNEYYDAQPQALDFYDDATIDIINQWADDHTHGMIPEIVDKTSFDHNAASILLNAIYFKGVWANKFDKAMTQDETFNGVETQPMMHQMEEFLYTENDLYQAVRLPYGNGAYEMTIFLPRKGKTIGEVLSQMDGKNWRPRYQSLYQVDLKMPRFQTETELPLNDTMKELGMPTAFTMGAEFPYFGNRDVFISQMFQKAKIELDEEGTKAAAVTEIWMVESACTDVAEFHANRPFFYIISEQSTGAIFFIGQYMGENPALAINSPARPKSKANNTYYDLTGRRVTTPTKGIYIHNGKIVMVK